MLVYKFRTAEWGLKALSKKTIKISKWNELNDPFELAAGDLSEREDRKKYHQYKEKLSKNEGLISFCGGWNNPVIWSHYADNHRGLALGFDIPDDKLSKIIYIKKRLPKRFSEITKEELTLTKFHHWSYEDEFRLVVSLKNDDVVKDGDVYTLPFGHEITLKRVIIGCEYEKQKDENFTHSLLDNGIDIITARAAFKEFMIVRQKLKRLWKWL